MGLQEVSEKKVRRASSETGLPIIRIMRHSNHLWMVWVRDGDGHYHVELDPESWEWQIKPGCGFTTCSEGMWGPNTHPRESNQDSIPKEDA